MQALDNPPLYAVRKTYPIRRRCPPGRRRTQQWMAIEVSTKLVVNLVLILIMATSLNRLVQNWLGNISKLQELKTSVEAARDQYLRAQLSFYQTFDPTQSAILTRQQNAVIEASRRNVVLSEQAQP